MCDFATNSKKVHNLYDKLGLDGETMIGSLRGFSKLTRFGAGYVARYDFGCETV